MIKQIERAVDGLILEKIEIYVKDIVVNELNLDFFLRVSEGT